MCDMKNICIRNSPACWTLAPSSGRHLNLSNTLCYGAAGSEQWRWPNFSWQDVYALSNLEYRTHPLMTSQFMLSLVPAGNQQPVFSILRTWCDRNPLMFNSYHLMCVTWPFSLESFQTKTISWLRLRFNLHPQEDVWKHWSQNRSRPMGTSWGWLSSWDKSARTTSWLVVQPERDLLLWVGLRCLCSRGDDSLKRERGRVDVTWTERSSNTSPTHSFINRSQVIKITDYFTVRPHQK